MKKLPTTNAEGKKPWLEPGYQFFKPGFPPGYVPHLAEEHCRQKSDAAIREAAARGRRTQLESGITGTIRGLSKRPGDASLAMVKKSKVPA